MIVYTANNLNQYTRREQAGVVPVFGEADTTATLKVLRNDTNAVSAKRVGTVTRDGKYYSGAVTVDNTTEKVVPFDVLAFKDDPTVPNKQLYTRKSSTYTVPQKLQPFTYDFDGNMLTFLISTYTWNGENGLITAIKGDKKVVCQYDYQGRRIEKKVFTQTSGNWTQTKYEKFVYDGWNQTRSISYDIETQLARMAASICMDSSVIIRSIISWMGTL